MGQRSEEARKRRRRRTRGRKGDVETNRTIRTSLPTALPLRRTTKTSYRANSSMADEIGADTGPRIIAATVYQLRVRGTVGTLVVAKKRQLIAKPAKLTSPSRTRGPRGWNRILRDEDGLERGCHVCVTAPFRPLRWSRLRGSVLEVAGLGSRVRGKDGGVRGGSTEHGSCQRDERMRPGPALRSGVGGGPCTPRSRRLSRLAQTDQAPVALADAGAQGLESDSSRRRWAGTRLPRLCDRPLRPLRWSRLRESGKGEESNFAGFQLGWSLRSKDRRIRTSRLFLARNRNRCRNRNEADPR